MSLTSMTGFARAQGVSGSYNWVWELKSVNAKGLDLRVRLPQGWDVVEAPVRAAAAGVLVRGSVSATLGIEREGAAPAVRVNEEALAAILETIKTVAKRIDAEPPRLDGVLGLRGVIELVDAEENKEERDKAESSVVEGFEQALASLVDARRSEGKALFAVLSERLDSIASLVAAAEASPARKPEAIRARLAEQVKQLLETGQKFDADRLHQEAVLIATRTDVREEIDRLTAHVAAARTLLTAGGAVGRKLDFLAQEFNREANTLCSKAGDVSLSAIGLELKALIDQFREQVQNLE